MTQVVAPLGAQIREWLMALTEDPSARVFGAQWCAKWFRAHLKQVAEKALETRAHIGNQLSGLEQKLALAAKTPVKAKDKDSATNPETYFLQHCQLRMYQLAAQSAAELGQGLAGFVSQGNDHLHDLGRDIKHLAAQFVAAEQGPAGEIDAAALAQLQQEEERSAFLVNQHFQEAVFSSAGFRAVLQGGQQRHELLAMLRQQARQAVLASLRQINLSSLVKELGKPDARGTSKLGALIASAQPWLQQVGGERRLLCVAGQGSGEPEGQSLTPAAMSGLISSAYFEQLPAVIPAATSQIVFCYEIGNVPLTQAAAQLINHCPAYAQAASRLHTRGDVTWRELPV